MAVIRECGMWCVAGSCDHYCSTAGGLWPCAFTGTITGTQMQAWPDARHSPEAVNVMAHRSAKRGHVWLANTCR
eukprot:365416-Chlamydomonas_euryale.AAC.9